MMENFHTSPAAILFDLDGTLIDSAADLINALNVLVTEQGKPPVDFEFARGAVSKGARAILRRGFPTETEAGINELLPRFLEVYYNTSAVHTRLYSGIDSVLAEIEKSGTPWGIVTNKPGWLTRPLLDKLELTSRCATLVTGDCLPVKKPDPAPLLHACRLIDVPAAKCVYIGDDLRDVQAGKAAGMNTLVAAWGYLDGEDPVEWQSNFIVKQPQDLLRLLDLRHITLST